MHGLVYQRLPWLVEMYFEPLHPLTTGAMKAFLPVANRPLFSPIDAKIKIVFIGSFPNHPWAPLTMGMCAAHMHAAGFLAGLLHWTLAVGYMCSLRCATLTNSSLGNWPYAFAPLGHLGRGLRLGLKETWCFLPWCTLWLGRPHHLTTAMVCNHYVLEMFMPVSFAGITLADRIASTPFELKSNAAGSAAVWFNRLTIERPDI